MASIAKDWTHLTDRVRRHPTAKKTPSPAGKQRPQPLTAHPDQQDPIEYVDVSHADADAPELAKYYSRKNSHAGNPETGHSNVPKMRLAPEPPANDSEKEEANKDELTRLKPFVPPQMPAPAEIPVTTETPGQTHARQPTNDLAEPLQQPVPMPSPRPRTLRQALAQLDPLAGPLQQPDSGVQKHALTSSLDTKVTSFSEYDGAAFGAISQRWTDLLDSHRFSEERTGRVVLRYKLMSDGSVIEMQMLENTVGDLLGYLCQEAIEEAAPFGKWPSDMTRLTGTNYRVITIDFVYY
jgi:hypothetical protein